ncbi:MAG TPA: type II secretion system protein GspG, partial [bacterium]|nr:type II secretion system protein GspG [bacterium]
MNLQQAFGGGEATGALDLSFLGDETFPIVDVAVAQEDRLIRWSYSESGMEGILTAFSLLKAISQQSFSGQTKRPLSKCEADLRTLKMGLESYFLDNTRYPESLSQLTEPIKYLNAIPTDPWTGKPYYYERREDSYILIGAGPDGKIDLDTKTIEGKFTAEKIPDSVRYHPAKGPDAGGDVIRVGP